VVLETRTEAGNVRIQKSAGRPAHRGRKLLDGERRNGGSVNPIQWLTLGRDVEYSADGQWLDADREWFAIIRKPDGAADHPDQRRRHARASQAVQRVWRGSAHHRN